MTIERRRPKESIDEPPVPSIQTWLDKARTTHRNRIDKLVGSLKTQQLADAFGSLRQLVDHLDEIETKLRAEILIVAKREPLIGQQFQATVLPQTRTTWDTDAIKADMPGSWVKKYSSKSNFFKVMTSIVNHDRSNNRRSRGE